ncbi:MAG TPA: 2-dehydro-3-deoxygalactonokinase, partial [Solirubrobacterales bacterium]|nr:2-dehydro-3-deoxygalactonokinase [Solirubrobacterales bacterium]
PHPRAWLPRHVGRVQPEQQWSRRKALTSHLAHAGFSAKGPRMRWPDRFIAADWGTTNRRAYRIDGQGRCEAEFEDGKGILAVANGGFPAAVAELRERLGNLPLLLAGMIGSNRGWVEAPYVPCAASIDDLVGGLAWPAEDVAIVPGVSLLRDERADVMRGEEVQLLGAVADKLISPDALVCHPGTHNKWAGVESGRIDSFRTVMTGELFNLLKEHSILSELLEQPAEPGEAFAAGVRRGLENDDLQAELFAVRARVLLGRAPRGQAASYTSGLLIGSDLRIGLNGARDRRVVVMGRPELTALYAAALSVAGVEGVELDGEQCFIAGIRHIARRIA